MAVFFVLVFVFAGKGRGMSLPDARGSRDGVYVLYQPFFRRSTRRPAAEHPYLAEIRPLENPVPRVFPGLLRQFWGRYYVENIRGCAGKARMFARKKCAFGTLFARKTRAYVRGKGAHSAPDLRGETTHLCAEKVRIRRLIFAGNRA